MLAATACSSEGDIAIREWTLVDSGGAHAIELPAQVDDLLAARPGSYRLLASVPLPAELRGRALTLAIPRLPARVALRVNGEPLESSESTLFVGYRSPGAHRWQIAGAKTERERLELELTVADTWFQSSWIGSIARLSAHPEGDRWYRFVSAYNVAANSLAIAFVTLAGLAYLIVFLGDRREVAHGWMAAQALAAASYPLFMLGPSQWLLGAYDLRIVPLVSIAALVSVGYTHSHFQMGAPSRWWLAVGAIIVAVMVVGQGPYSGRWSMWIAVGVVVLVTVYQLVLSARRLVRGGGAGDPITQLAAWTVLAMTAGLDLMYWLGFGGWHRGLQGAGLGLTIFALLQMVTFSREHLRAMRNAKMLNEELRRQVGERSRQLTHALARLGRTVSSPVVLTEGTVVDDRYRVVRRLGEGAMATVYQVVRLEDGCELALKQLKTSSDARILARFAREAHIAAEVSHPNLVGIHDIDFASAGFMYIVMDLVRGGPLNSRRERFGDVPWALEVLRQTAQGLAALHAGGVIHRDLKPGNILLELGESIVAKISDFGVSGMSDDTGDGLLDVPRALARQPGDTAVTKPALESGAPTLETVSMAVGALARNAALDSPLLTQAGHLLGTPAYMAPELHEGVRNDPACDVFSFGIVAFELLTGERPYATPPLLSRLHGQDAGEARRLDVACPTLPSEVARELQAAVSLVAAERPRVETLIAALGPRSPARAARQATAREIDPRPRGGAV